MRRRFGGLVGLGEEANCLLGRDRAIEGTARFGGDAQRLQGGAQLRLTETVGGDFAAHRKRRKRKNVGDDLALDFDFDRAGDACHGKVRVGRQRLLNPDRLGDAEFVVGRLQAAVIEQGDLHGRIRGQGSLEQAFDFGACRCFVLLGADRDDVLVEGLPGNIGRHRHSAVLRKCLAGSE